MNTVSVKVSVKVSRSVTVAVIGGVGMWLINLRVRTEVRVCADSSQKKYP